MQREILLALAIAPLVLVFTGRPSLAAPVCRVVQCSGQEPRANPQLCQVGPTVGLRSATTTNAVRISAPQSHCADIRYAVVIHSARRALPGLLPGDSAPGFSWQTDWLTRGQSYTVDTGPRTSSETVTVSIRAAWSRTGGCNSGRLASYSVCIERVNR